MFHPVDKSQDDQYTVVPSGALQDTPKYGDEDIALKEHKRRKTLVDVNLKTVTNSDGYKPRTNVPVDKAKTTSRPPCQVDVGFDEIFTAKDLNIQLHAESSEVVVQRSGIQVVTSFYSRQYTTPKKYDDYKSGSVVFGSKEAVKRLLTANPKELKDTTGVIIDVAIHPSADCQFSENNEFSVEKAIGRGAFGKVTYCRHFTTKTDFVGKQVVDKFHRTEVDVLMQLDHPNITRFLGFVIKDEIPEILMEYAGQQLKELMKLDEYKKILNIENINLSFQGLNGLSYMHSYGILHLNINPENICITEEPLTLKITDFGSSKTPQEPVSCVGCTPEYMSPEACKIAIIDKLPYLKDHVHINLSGKADNFAFALTVAYMLCGRHIVRDIILKYLMKKEEQKNLKKYMDVRTKILFYSFDDVNFIKKRAIDDSWPDYMKVFMNNTLEGDAQSRWSSTEGRDFFRDKMKQEVPSLPEILDQVPTGSPSASSSGGVNIPFFSQIKSSLSSNWSTGDLLTSKMVKNKLRMKLKQSSRSQPYTITRRRGPPQGHSQAALPDFNVLLQ
ncbi:probable myosin light chain kinase DDB_G0275057 isoform X2 [Gigantopelta aegis]|uniref:probable myosin light chain kinase DDB_G0275057 isoform X2 n=1 Tax=Gigantopelta aegis TaxID=1735272 RepID=UPI001B88E161|nr:probable myosin light chain kinase DDB_G0275057 isoform X2 [Gigantopelta aegis]